MPPRFPFDDWDEIVPIVPTSVRLRRNRHRIIWGLACMVFIIGGAVFGLVILNG